MAQKSLPKFGAIFCIFVPLKSSFSPKRSKKERFSFETGPKCRQQIGLKVFFAVGETRGPTRNFPLELSDYAGILLGCSQGICRADPQRHPLRTQALAFWGWGGPLGRLSGVEEPLKGRLSGILCDWQGLSVPLQRDWRYYLVRCPL